MHVIEPLVVHAGWGNQVNEHDTSSRFGYPSHFTDSGLRVSKVMQRATTEHQVERLGEEWQGLSVAFLKEDIVNRRVQGVTATPGT